MFVFEEYMEVVDILLTLGINRAKQSMKLMLRVLLLTYDRCKPKETNTGNIVKLLIVDVKLAN